MKIFGQFAIENENKRKFERCWRRAEVLGLWFAAFVGVAAICFGHREAAEQSKLLLNQIQLDHPPKLKIINIWMNIKNASPDANIILKPGLNLVGDIPLLNVGDNTATITEMWCAVEWRHGPLPMYRSFFDPNDPRKCGKFGYNSINLSDRNKILPGSGAEWPFTTVVPSEFSNGMELYIVGAVRFKDEHVSNRFMTFARRYDQRKGRFVLVGDPNYESDALEQPNK